MGRLAHPGVTKHPRHTDEGWPTLESGVVAHGCVILVDKVAREGQILTP
jgi:hypothetical protein